jgi:nucleoside-diphosphate-sugar epimerase
MSGQPNDSATTPYRPAGDALGPLCLVTGGAGFMGINLVRYLLCRGYSVRSLDIAPFAYPERDRVDVIEGDIRDRATVERAVAGVELVFHCAAALPRSRPEDIRSSIVDGTRNVLAAALRGSVARVVYVSSTAVYGIPDHHPLREDDRLEGVGPYGEAKIAAEDCCREFRSQGLCVPILRPKSFVGPERLGIFAILYDWAADGRHFPIIGAGANRYQLLDVEDLCQACLLCATAPAELANDTFNVGAREFGTMREDFQAVLDRAGHGRRIIAFPRWPAIQALRLLEALHLSPLYRWVYETAATDSFVSCERIETKLGFVARYSNRDALLRNYEWYLAHRDEVRASSGVSHRVQWRQGLLGLLKLLF